MIKYILMFASTVGFCYAQSQESWQEDIAEWFVESEQPDEEQLDILVNELQELKEHPININQREEHERLSQLVFLSHQEKVILTEWIKKNAPLVDIRELRFVKGIAAQKIDWLVQVVELGEVASKQPFLTLLNAQLYGHRIIQKQKGYLRQDSGAYLGSPWKQGVRLKASGVNWKFNFRAAKARGEKGMDDFTAAVQLKKEKHEVFLGDYQLRFGQGLHMGLGYALGKSVYSINWVQGDAKYGVNNGTFSGNYLRGVLLKSKIGNNIESAVWYSFKKLSGRVQGEESTIYWSSMHRTYTELEKKNRISEEVIGARLGVKTGRFKLGLGGSYSKCLPSRLGLVSLDYSYVYRNYWLYGEKLLSPTNTGMNSIDGLWVNLGEALSLHSQIRGYQSEAKGNYARSLSEYANSSGELGWLTGLQYQKDLWEVNVLVDQFQRKGKKYYTDRGREYALRITTDNKTVRWYLQLNSENKREDKQDLEEAKVYNKRVHKAKTVLQIQGSENWRLRSQMGVVKSGLENGFWGAQSFRFSWQNFMVMAQMIFFETESWDTRVYITERDPQGLSGMYAFYGHGYKLNSGVRWKKGNLTFDLKFSHSHKYGAETLHSGNEEIEGPNRSEIKFNFRYQMRNN